MRCRHYVAITERGAKCIAGCGQRWGRRLRDRIVMWIWKGWL